MLMLDRNSTSTTSTTSARSAAHPTGTTSDRLNTSALAKRGPFDAKGNPPGAASGCARLARRRHTGRTACDLRRQG
jgi:hypothetical protein